MDSNLFELKVLYRIQNINYDIIYSPNYKKQINDIDKKIINNNIIDNNLEYLIYIQNKKQLLYAIFINITNDDHIKIKFNSIFEFVNWLSTNLKKKYWIMYKNVKREITFLQEFNQDDYNIIKKMELFCLDSFMKYKLCLSIFIQGKIINNRFRIPTIDEYLICEKIDTLPLSKNEFKKQISFIKYIKLQLFDIFKNYHNITGIKNIFINNIDNLKSLLNYYLFLGIECYQISYIVDKLSMKKHIEQNWDNTKYPIDFLTIEGLKKKIKQPKNSYELLILDNCNIDVLLNDSIVISIGNDSYFKNNLLEFISY
jgi:hypothetical protein